MRQQQRKSHPGKEIRSASLLEIVLGSLHLLLGGSVLTLLLVMWFGSPGRIIRPVQPWYDIIGQLTVVLTLLATALAGLLLLCRQRRIALWLQTVSVLAALVGIPMIFISILRSGGGFSSNEGWFWFSGFLTFALWMTLFAWFIKKQESET